MNPTANKIQTSHTTTWSLVLTQTPVTKSALETRCFGQLLSNTPTTFGQPTLPGVQSDFIFSTLRIKSDIHKTMLIRKFYVKMYQLLAKKTILNNCFFSCTSISHPKSAHNMHQNVLVSDVLLRLVNNQFCRSPPSWPKRLCRTSPGGGCQHYSQLFV